MSRRHVRSSAVDTSLCSASGTIKERERDGKERKRRDRDEGKGIIRVLKAAFDESTENTIAASQKRGNSDGAKGEEAKKEKREGKQRERRPKQNNKQQKALAS